MTYNKTLGPSLQILIVYPLKIFTWFFEQLCPIWNAAVWLWKKISPQLGHACADVPGDGNEVLQKLYAN